MIILLFATLLILLAMYGGKFVRKHNVKIYIGVLILSIIAFILKDKVAVFNPFLEGFVGLSFFYVVMITGALKDKSKLKVKLMGLRREYSIIGFMLISIHGIRYYLEYFGDSPALERLVGVIAFVIMIPLFITSFMKIRKKMSRQSWVKLQRFAYLAYVLIFIHLLLMAEMPNLLVYIILFVPYFILKTMKEYKNIRLIKAKNNV